jgi:D-3-phosphoglycerate dehydrogenase / 2-oxoglutarate reductase
MAEPPLVVMSERLGAIGPIERRIEATGARLVVAPLWTAEDLLANGAAADVLIVGASEPVTRDVLGKLRTRCVVRRGVGVDNVDVAAATELGIPVGYVPAASVEEVSDHALALLLASERRLFDIQDAARAGDTGGAGAVGSQSRRFCTLTLGIAGFGRIGRALARKSRGIFAAVLAADPVVDPAEAEALGVTLVPLDRLLRESDLISLHAPAPADHQPLLDETALAKLRPGVVVVNTARGELIDEAALLAAIESGAVARAALDVTREEPLPESSPLRSAPHVRLTAHTGAKGRESGSALRTAVVEAVLAALAGQAPAFLADPAVVHSPRYRLVPPTQENR